MVTPWSENEGEHDRWAFLLGHKEQRGKTRQHQSGNPHIPLECRPSVKESVKLGFPPLEKIPSLINNVCVRCGKYFFILAIVTHRSDIMVSHG